MTEGYFEKLKDNIVRTGNYPALIVRPYGEYYQIIDGHHRWMALQEIGYTEILCQVWQVDDKQTKLLLATLNRIKGTDDTEKRARLLKDLKDEFDRDLLYFIPESEEALDSMLDALAKDTFDLKLERGLIEEKLIQSGVDDETATRISKSLHNPGGKAIMKFVFIDDVDYNIAVDYFGTKPSGKALVELIEYANNTGSTKKKV